MYVCICMLIIYHLYRVYKFYKYVYRQQKQQHSLLLSLSLHHSVLLVLLLFRTLCSISDTRFGDAFIICKAKEMFLLIFLYIVSLSEGEHILEYIITIHCSQSHVPKH